MKFCSLRHTLLTLACGLVASLAAAQSVSITSPGANATVGSPMHVTATASSARALQSLQLYLDGAKVYEVSGTTMMDRYQAASAGTHRVTVQAIDSIGYVFKSTIYATVGSASTTTTTSTPTTTPTSTPTSTVPATAASITGIDQMTGWESCDACAGANGAGPATLHSMNQGVSSPSLDGASAQFNISPAVSYSNALWWKQLGPQDSASHFAYDLWFYIKNPAAAQALEFDSNQSVNGRKWIFGTQCDIRGAMQWQVWDSVTLWTNTGVACSQPTAYVWHHLVWEFERAGDKTHFIALTYDGVKHYINRYQNTQASSVRELNVAFQMDTTVGTTGYSTWLDNVTLKYW